MRNDDCDDYSNGCCAKSSKKAIWQSTQKEHIFCYTGVWVRETFSFPFGNIRLCSFHCVREGLAVWKSYPFYVTWMGKIKFSLHYYLVRYPLKLHTFSATCYMINYFPNTISTSFSIQIQKIFFAHIRYIDIYIAI